LTWPAETRPRYLCILLSPSLACSPVPQIAALILENTFTSLPSLVPHALPLLGPFSFLCHQKWDSASKVPLIPATTPILMLSGVADELVPKEHMRALWEVVARRGETKTPGGVEFSKGLERAKYLEFEHGGHSAFNYSPLFLQWTEGGVQTTPAYNRGIGLQWQSSWRTWGIDRGSRRRSYEFGF
jgi:hypothetical protein